MTVGTPSSSSRTSRRLRALAGALILAVALLGLGVQSASAASGSASANLGGGVLNAQINYAAPGVQPLDAQCTPSESFSFNTVSSSITLAVNLQTTVNTAALPIIGNGTPGNDVGDGGFAGNVPSVAGGGSAGCDNLVQGGGTLTLTLPTTTDSVNDNSFGCDGTTSSPGSSTLEGTYNRVGNQFAAVLTGFCDVNKDPVRVALLLDGTWQPAAGSGLMQPGISAPATTASLVGPFVVLPLP